MKKKAIIGLSCLVLSTIGVAACGASTGTDVSNQETTTTQEMTTEAIDSSTTTTYETTESTEATTTTTESSVATNYDDWHTQIVTSKDSIGGYVYETELKISNFIAAENEDRILAAWNEVSNGNEFSEPICRTKTGAYFNHIYNNPETYKFYAVGTITHNNITEDFENDELNGTYWFDYDENYDIGVYTSADVSDIFGKLYFEEGVKNFICQMGSGRTLEITSENDDLSYYLSPDRFAKKAIKTKKFRNSIGPTPFILVIGFYTGKITPNHPEPEPIPDRLMLKFEVPGDKDAETDEYMDNSKVEVKVEQRESSTSAALSNIDKSKLIGIWGGESDSQLQINENMGYDYSYYNSAGKKTGTGIVEIENGTIKFIDDASGMASKGKMIDDFSLQVDYDPGESTTVGAWNYRKM